MLRFRSVLKDREFWRGLAVFLLFSVVCFALLGLLGCSQLPSVAYCDKVLYDRSGSEITIEAHCRV